MPKLGDEAGTEANAEALKWRSYQDRILSMRSKSHKFMQISVIVSPLVFLLCITVMYVAIRLVTSSYSGAISILDKLVLTSRTLHTLPLLTRLISLGLLQNDTARWIVGNEHFYDERTEWKGVESYISSVLDTESDKAIVKQWKTLMPIVYYYSKSGSYGTQTMTMRAFNTELLAITQQMLDSNFTMADYGMAAETNQNLRFLFDNCPSTVRTAYIALDQLYNDKLVSAAKTSQTILGIVIGVSLAALLGISVILFRNALQEAMKERLSLLRLFTDLPKHVISKQMETDSHDLGDGIDKSLLRGRSSNVTIPVFRTLLFRFVGSIFVMLVLLIVLFSFTFVAVSNFKTIGTALMQTGFIGVRARRMHYIAVDIGYFDYRLSLMTNVSNLTSDNETVPNIMPLTWPNGYASIVAEANKTLGQFKESFTIATSAHGGLTDVHDATINDLLYTRPCQVNETGYIYALNHSHRVSNCQPGMQSLMLRYLNRLDEWFGLPAGSHNLSSSLYKELHSLDLGQLADWMHEAMVDLENHHINKVDEIMRTASIIFAISFPVVVAVYLLLLKLVIRVRDENLEASKMLLTVPMFALESVPSIRQFLETGEHDTYEAKAAVALEETNVRTKSILEAAADAIMIMNEHGTIEMFNNSAEELFGWTADEVVGRSAGTLLPALQQQHVAEFFESAGKEAETIAATKAGEEVPVLVSLSKGEFRGMGTYAAFVRDMRSLSRYKELVAENQKLMGVILPTTLTSKLAKAQKGSIIAKDYKSATVLFADIVGFTGLASRQTAPQVFATLQALFHGWDDLLEPHGIEKIKTIGDSYMACAGAPVECADHAQKMMNFAVDMFSVLNKYNQLSGGAELQIRIGINSGPVVGGVVSGRRMLFDIIGQTVNIAARMESAGIPGRVQVGDGTRKLLLDDYEFEERPGVEIKGEGLVTTYLLVRKIAKPLTMTQGGLGMTRGGPQMALSGKGSP